MLARRATAEVVAGQEDAPANHLRLVERDPNVELTVDLESQVVHLPGDEDLPFDVDPFSKVMLLKGTDEPGYLLDKVPAIEAWEAAHPPRVDTREHAGTSA